MAEVRKIVDPDNGAGPPTTDYTSLDAWEDAFGGHTSGDGDLVTDQENVVAECRASSGTADTTPVDIAGWTTSADYNVTVESASSDKPTSKWDTSIYRLECTTATAVTALDVDADHTVVDGLQIGTKCTGSWENASMSVKVAEIATIKNCIIRGTQTGANAGVWVGIYEDWGNSVFSVWNCVIYYDVNGLAAGNDHRGIDHNSGTLSIYNCTIAHCRTDAIDNDATCTVINTISYNNVGTQFDGTFEDASN